MLSLQTSPTQTDKKISVDYLNQLPSNDYIIGPGDTLEIIISRDLVSRDLVPSNSELGLPSSDLASPNLVRVDGEGTINLPKLERIYVSGLTINELNTILNEAYQKFIKFPKVETTIFAYRPIRVFVEGEVVNPGLKTMEGSLSIQSLERRKSNQNTSRFSNENTTTSERSNNNSFFFPTVFDAIRASGGITQYSNLKNIQIKLDSPRRNVVRPKPGSGAVNGYCYTALWC